MKLQLRRVGVPTPGARDARRGWAERESVLVQLSDPNGPRGVGEASPLPGYSPESLDAVEAALGALDPARVAEALEGSPARAALAAVAALLPRHLPSARMALETAALDLLGQRQGVAAPELLGAEPGARRPAAQLVGPASLPELLPASERAVRVGYRHLKLKLGAPGQLEAELNGVEAVRARHGDGVALRLDANGALDSAELERAWLRLASLGIELFEEPGALPLSLRGVLPLALDESLQGLDPASALTLLSERQARYAVLKPMALGGLSHCWSLAERARAVGITPLFSHCFDGPFAWRAAAALALALPASGAHGLAPHAGLQGWPLREPLAEDGSIHAWNSPGLGSPAETSFQ